MRTSSGNRKIKGFGSNDSVRPESQRTTPNSVRRDTGMGWDRGGKNDLPPFTERRAREFAWAERHLPEEHPGLVVSALISLELAGENQSTKTVFARLKAQGKTAEQMREKGWL